MDPVENSQSPSLSKVQRVRQAADVLGISERTVYRRLRSGRLEELPAGNHSADSVMSIVSEERMVEIISSQIAPQIDRFVCQNDMTNDNLAALRQELARRDAQIETLLQNQQELTHTIQKLQEQIYELARLALTRPTSTEETTPDATPAISAPIIDANSHENGLKRWLRSLRQRYRGK